ncbi:MAG: hypothetical protein ACFFFO_12880 [Candidatus Thorarchaeota archaeon]
MALEGDDFTQQRTGPKAFTEYSFNALLVMVGLVGSFLSVIGGASFYIFLLPFSSVFDSFFGSSSFISGIIGLIMIPFGITQLYYAWKIHSENFTDFQTIILISWTQLVLSIISAIFMGFLILFAIQLVLGQAVLNIIVIFFLGKTEVQQEFVWSTGEY